jgi:hypothetical protein
MCSAQPRKDVKKVCATCLCDVHAVVVAINDCMLHYVLRHAKVARDSTPL